MTFSLLKRPVLAACLTGVAVFAISAPFMMASRTSRVRGDGIFYFATLRSIYWDGDIDLSNEADRYPWIRESYGTPLPNGLVASPFAMGSSILWLPFYALGDAYCNGRSAQPCDGYSAPYVRAVMLGTLFWATLGLILTALSLKKLTPAASWTASWTVVIIMALTSPLVFYLTSHGDYAHGNSFFCVALLLYLTVDLLRRSNDLRIWHALAYGLAIGLAFLVRWQDLVAGLLAVPVILHVQKQKRIGMFMALTAGVLIGVLPQLVVWRLLYGTLVTIPQGSGFLSFQNVDVLKFLFSNWNGVFLWHPLLLLASLGLVLLVWRARVDPQRSWLPFALASCLIVFLEMAVSSMSLDWWSGGSYGQRRLISVLPLLCVGLQQICGKGLEERTWKTSIVAMMVAWNLLTVTRYYQGKVPLNPADPWWYFHSKVPYGHFDYARRFSDVLFGTTP